MIFQRTISKSLHAHLSKKQITVITGMRRTGKTTLLKWLLESIKSNNKIYIDLERIDNQELFTQKNYDAIIAALVRRGMKFSEPATIALDEIQLVPSIPSVLKYLYDTYTIKFLVTGSSSYYLKNLFSESLAGRKKIFELYPLDFGEFLTFRAISFQKGTFMNARFISDEYTRLSVYYEEFIRFGGFPEVVLARNDNEKTDYLQDIISSYINIDVKALIDFKSQRDIYTLVKMLATRTGTRLDYSKLSRLSGLSRITVQNYIELFEKTYLLALVPVFTKNIDREIVKAKKIYLCDTGILNILAEVDGGSQFENALYNQLRSHGELSYYALKSGEEIDFVFNQSIACEAKESPTAMDARALSRLAKNAGLSRTRLIGRRETPKFTKYIWGGAIR